MYSTPYEVWAIICSLPTCPPLHRVVLAALYQKKVIAQHDLQKRRGDDAQEVLCHIILDQCTKPSEDVATTADVLDTVGCKKEADMLRCKLGLC